MKKYFVFLLFLPVGSLFAQTSGVLKVSFSTSATELRNSTYAPRNCLAIWIEDQSGNFVKTLLSNAQKQRSYLTTWKESTTAAASRFNTVDAVTGATNDDHGLRNCSWDGMDFKGKLLPDGAYKLIMELTDINGAGRIYEITFKKGSNGFNQNLPDRTSFKSINLTWQPSIKSTASR